MKSLISLLFVLFFASTSQAWFVFEPFIGYNRGQTVASRVQGIGLGVRTGIEYRDFFVLIDYGMHDVQQGSISGVKYTDMAIVLGGDLKDYRVWYGLISSSSYSYKSGASDISSKGTGSKLGISAKITGKTWVNLELKYVDYTETTSAGVTSPVSDISTIGFLSLSWLL